MLTAGVTVAFTVSVSCGALAVVGEAQLALEVNWQSILSPRPLAGIGVRVATAATCCGEWR